MVGGLFFLVTASAVCLFFGFILSLLTPLFAVLGFLLGIIENVFGNSHTVKPVKAKAWNYPRRPCRIDIRH